MSSFPLSGDTEMPSERRAVELREGERARLLAVGEQRRFARRMQALTSQLRLSTRPSRARSDRRVEGRVSDGRR
jgi:hypothetical protein